VIFSGLTGRTHIQPWEGQQAVIPGTEQMVSAMPAALQGLVVLDLTRVLAGPYAGQILGDLGADVIKVERPGSGDEGRRFGVNALPDSAGGRSDDTSFHLAANRNKRSLTLDFSKPEGREILLGLIDKADVLLENFKAGTMARLGLDEPSVRGRRPSLIYCSITGYGQTGPYAARPGYDGVFQAQSGLMNITGPADDEPNSKPCKTGPSMVDISSGMYAAMGVMAALHHRNRTGEGQHLDISLLDCAIAMTSHSAMEYLISGASLPRMGNQGNGGAPGSTFACQDGYIYLSPGTEHQYRRLCEAMNLEHLLDMPQFATSRLRFENRHELNPMIEAATSAWAVDALSEALNAAGVPAGVVNNYERVFADPQVCHRQVRVEMSHPVVDTVSLIASPLRLSASPPSYRHAPPRLGEHSEEVLAEFLALQPDTISGLREKGIV